jgi:hypothetical protein
LFAFVNLTNFPTWLLKTIVVDPWHIGTDPDPRIRASDQWIRIQILLFSSLTLKMPTETIFF